MQLARPLTVYKQCGSGTSHEVTKRFCWALGLTLARHRGATLEQGILPLVLQVHASKAAPMNGYNIPGALLPSSIPPPCQRNSGVLQRGNRHHNHSSVQTTGRSMPTDGESRRLRLAQIPEHGFPRAAPYTVLGCPIWTRRQNKFHRGFRMLCT